MVVDTNSIPASAIQRVEVISGGASAVYGADAVGGVVNFILKDNFEGASVDVRFGDTQHGGDQTVTMSALIGANAADDRGNVMIGIERDTRAKAYAWQRDWRVADYRESGARRAAPSPSAARPGGTTSPSGTTEPELQAAYAANAPSIRDSCRATARRTRFQPCDPRRRESDDVPTTRPGRRQRDLPGRACPNPHPTIGCTISNNLLARGSRPIGTARSSAGWPRGAYGAP